VIASLVEQLKRKEVCHPDDVPGQGRERGEEEYTSFLEANPPEDRTRLKIDIVGCVNLTECVLGISS
jgi:hypothetical protein